MMCYFLCKSFLGGLFFGTIIPLVAALIAYFVAKECD